MTASDGFSEDALREAASGMDSGALSVARRHDPLAGGQTLRDRQVALFTARLERDERRTRGDLMLRASLPALEPALPLAVSGALQASRDLQCLTQAVYYEARGETPAGQAAVAQVVLNRVRSSAFPGSVCAVVFQGAGGKGCQFSFACNGAMNAGYEGGAWTRAQRVASRALAGYVMSAVGRSTHFHTTAVAPAWGPRMVRVAQVGSHVFYRFARRGEVAAPDLAPPADIQRVFAAPAPSLDGVKPATIRLTSLTLEPAAAQAVAGVSVPASAIAAADKAAASAAKPAGQKPVIQKAAGQKPASAADETAELDAKTSARVVGAAAS
ncbi:cell wall hydrolase [Phenylobacterium sp.]|uniref:cell wall hydrolase n=1 Tax=Phenylobacterium sp. TaxID=1871053 RepID=UPI0035AD9507